jgi:hypothetical protein
MDLREAYVNRRQAEIDALEAQLRTYELKVQDVPLDDQMQFYRDLPGLHDQLAKARLKLGNLEQSDATKWDELEQDLTLCLKELQSGMKHAGVVEAISVENQLEDE